MKHYLIAGVVFQETVEKFGDEELIKNMTEGAPYPWTFVRKEEVDGISGHPKVAYVFERWEDE